MKSPDRRVPSFEFGLVAWLEATRVVLPLKGVECRFDVTGTIGCVELDQIYHQNMSQPLDCTYTFPLPAGAAVYRCELHVNGRVIRAKVEEQAAAKRIFREQKAAGRRAALVESERENLFTLSLGNVQPDDVIVVRFAWFQLLDREAGALCLRVPTCPGVRYIPGEPLLRSSAGRGTVDDTDQVPDASRITPPRIDALHPDAAYFSIEGRLSRADADDATVSSPSHAILVRESGEQVTVALSSGAAVPDRDFVLSWHEPKAHRLEPQAWNWTEGTEPSARRATTYALVQLRAPAEVPIAAGGSAQDFYFLVDRSGSMQGAKWERTCEALRAFVGLLGAEDRVWITLFESTYRDFSEAPMLAPAVLADRGFQRMAALGTAGGTELLPAAKHVMEKIAAHSAERRASVVLITDGQVGNEAAITSAFAKIPKVRVHAFGIDTAVNDAFLKELARRHRGGCWLQTPNDDIAGTIAALGGRLQRPVITDLAVHGSTWQPGAGMWPDLHAEEIVTISLRGEAGAPLEIRGRLPDGREHRFAVTLESVGSEAVKLLWAKERITTLLESGKHAEAIALAREHNLICKGAAFVAWDEAEQVQIAREELVQPVLESKRVMSSMLGVPTPGDLPRYAVRHSLISPDRYDCAKMETGSHDAILDSWGIADDQLVPQVRQALEKIGVSNDLIDTWLATITKAKGNRGRALMTLLMAASSLEAMRNVSAAMPLLWKRIESGMRQTSSASLNDLVKWSQELYEGAVALQSVQLNLHRLGVPAQVIDALCAWVFESGQADRERLKNLMRHVEFLGNLPFSAASAGTRWQAFLDKAIDTRSETYEVVVRWLSEARVARST